MTRTRSKFKNGSTKAAHDTVAKRQQRAPLQYLLLSLPPATMQAIDNHIY
jgi:hypothetical protein